MSEPSSKESATKIPMVYVCGGNYINYRFCTVIASFSNLTIFQNVTTRMISNRKIRSVAENAGTELCIKNAQKDVSFSSSMKLNFVYNNIFYIHNYIYLYCQHSGCFRCKITLKKHMQK